MKANSLIIALVIAIVLVSATASAVAIPREGKSDKKYLTERVDEKSLKEFQDKGCEIVKHSKRIASLQCPDDVADALNLREDIKVFAVDLTADRQIGADTVWNMNYTGANRMVAVADTGIDYNHAELSDSYAGGWNFVKNNNNPYDDNGHGTHVSGIITANGIDPNAKGVSPDAKILALKVLDSTGSGTFSDVISAIYYAVDGPDGIYGTADDPHTDAISMSLGTSAPYIYPTGNCDNVIPEVTNAIHYAISRGVAVVAAAGNDGNGISIPGCVSGTIAVGAVNSNNVRASWSGAGDSLDIVAPGVNIYSTWPGGYATLSGTSMATPHVSAVVALLKQANSTLSVSDIKNALYNTANDLGTTGWDPYYGYGLVNAAAAINYVLPQVPIHDVAVSSISMPPSAVNGSVVTINVGAADVGNQAETFNVVVSDLTDSIVIGSQSVSLNAFATKSLSFSFNTALSSIGNHTIEARASAVPGETNTANNAKTAALAITLPPPKPAMHIASMTMAKQTDSYSRTRAVATVMVVNASGSPVSGANVSVHWSGLASNSGSKTTGSSGKATFYSSWRRNANGTFTITVDDIAKSGWVYDYSANAVSSASIKVP